MRWLLEAEAAEALGVSQSTLRTRAEKDPSIRRWVETGKGRWGGHWLYAAADGEHTTRSRPQARPEPPRASAAITATLKADEGATGWQERDGYVFDGDRDCYIVTIQGHRAPFVRSGEWVRSIWRAYTNGATIADVCRDFEIDRKTFDGFKRALSLTKTRAPWTDEELESTDAEDLFHDALRIKEREVLSKVERTHWRRLKDDATKWRTFHASVRDAVSALDIDPVIVPRVRVPESMQGGGTVMVGLTDMHIGKRTAGADHTLAEQCEEIGAHVARAIETAATRFGVPDRWATIVGSDAIHVDTASQTTTAGTAQGAQSVGSSAMMVRAAVELYSSAIDQLATTAPVDVEWVDGNHDRLLSLGVACALEQRYRNTDRVTVRIRETPVRWIPVGDEGGAFAVTHGDGMTKQQAVEWVRAEAPPWVNQRRVVMIQGHLHRESFTTGGLPVLTLSAPCHGDDWHALKGYVSRAAINLVRHDGSMWTDMVRVA